MSTTTLVPRRGTARRAGAGRLAAGGAAAVLLANAVIGLAGDVDDHTTALGAASEVTAGLAFLAGALALLLLRPVRGPRGLLWSLAPAGLAVAGTTMLLVPVVGSEPSEWGFVLAVLPTFVGLVAAGVIGTSARLWPWWVGAGLALFLPVMFLAPLNSVVMALAWAGVAATSRPRPGH